MKKPPKPDAKPFDDVHLWRAVADSARPLHSKRARSRPALPSIPSASTPPPARPTSKAAMSPALGARGRFAPNPAARPLPVLHPGAAPGVDRATAARLRKGEIAIDATLDLHGLTQKEAHAALVGQITRAHGLGRRCLLVITGKGGKPDTEGRTSGVLRANVPRWLNEPPARAHVLAFAAAQLRHGGQGALYVLLRRTRETRSS
jgi:DNA-nicking Smr family endonuclease